MAEIKAAVPPGDYVLQPEGNGQQARAQVFRDSGKTFLATVLPRVPGQTALTFSLAPRARSDSSAPGVEFREAGTNLEVSVGGKPFTVYRTDEPTKPYFYPVIGPTGRGDHAAPTR